MIELISSLFKEGDFIRLFFNNSSRSVEGTIIKILPSSIAIKSIDGKISGVKGDDIDSFDSDSSANIDNIVSEENNELTPVPVEPSIVNEETIVSDASNEEGGKAKQSDQEVQPLNTDKETEIKEQSNAARFSNCCKKRA